MTKIMDSGAAASVRDIRQQEVITEMVINHTLSHPRHLSIREKRGFQTIAPVKLVQNSVDTFSQRGMKRYEPGTVVLSMTDCGNSSIVVIVANF